MKPETRSCYSCDDLINSECDECWGQGRVCTVCEMPGTECECIEEEFIDDKSEPEDCNEELTQKREG